MPWTQLKKAAETIQNNLHNLQIASTRLGHRFHSGEMKTHRFLSEFSLSKLHFHKNTKLLRKYYGEQFFLFN